MERELMEFAKELLQEDFIDFKEILSEYKNADKEQFALSHKKLIELSCFDIEDIDEIVLFQSYARQVKRMFFVDWIGEEYAGQIKRSINLMLKNYTQENLFRWDQKIFNKKYSNVIDRGDFVPLLLREMNKVLSQLGYCIAIFVDCSDTYSYCLLPTNEMQKVIGISTDEFAIIDTKLYSLYLFKLEQKNAKLLIYLKNRFSLPLNGIKAFIAQEKILLSRGNLLTVTKEQDEIKKIGGNTIIEETN